MHVQIERALRDAARSGRLPPGAALPSSRTLARDLGVSRGVVVEAYEQLMAEGFLETRRASGTTIARAAGAAWPDRAEAPPARFAFDFRPGLPDLTRFPREDWARAARRVMRQLRPGQLDYGDPRGASELRNALAQYLGRVRGVLSGESRVVVCSGFAQALGIAARGLASRGVRRLAMEDPSHPDQRRILSRAGLTPVAVPVDRHGLVTERLEGARAEAVLVSPAHQFPTGSVLAPERRRALIAWAERESAFVIEDDYDAEYRYDRAPVGALQGLAPDRVVYAGSTSKILAPALRLGWLVVP
jgi:GntR family transcriptional regulator/MocR family aminotransferase